MIRKNYLTILLVLLISCNSNKVFHKTHTFSDYQWHKRDKVIFKPKLEIQKETLDCYFELNIRYIQGFPYKYLNLLITVTRPDGTEAEKEESIQIRKDDGSNIGDGAGDYWDLDYTITETFLFDQPGLYKIEITPLIDKGPIYFINKLGLTILKKPED